MKCVVRAQYIEIYNEKTMDLLAAGKESVEKKLREIPKKGFQVVGCESSECTDIEGVFNALALGNSRRKVSGTGLNARSSRSHTIFIMDMETELQDGSKASMRLNLVDLAGSERISKTGATGDTLKEAQKINLSLTTLGMVISKLVKGDANIPFRDSSLTKMLKESLGGNAKTCLICTLSKREEHIEESIQTLEFASRARAIKSKAKVNVVRSAEELEKIIKTLQAQVDKLKDKVKSKGLDPKKILQSFTGVKEEETEQENTDEIQLTTEQEGEPNEDNNIKLIQIQAKIDNLKEKHIRDMTELEELLENSKNPENHELVLKLSEKLSEKNGELIELQDKLDDLKSKTEILRHQLEELNKNNQIDDLEIEFNTSERNLNDARDQLSAINIQRTNIDNEIEVYQKKLENLKEDCSKLNEQIVEFESINSFTKNEIISLTKDNAQLTTNLVEKESYFIQIKTLNETIQSNIDKMNIELQTI